MPVSIVRRGQTVIEAAEALAVDVLVGPSLNGRAQVAVATQFVRGIVVKAAAAAGDEAVIELYRTSIALS